MNKLGRAGALVALTVTLAGMTVAQSTTANADAVHQVYGTGGVGLSIRSAPTTSSTRIGGLAEGASISIHCQTYGDNINGSTIWDQLAGGGYVSDWYVNTPNVGTFSPGIGQCGQAPPPPPPPPPAPPPAAAAVAGYDRAAAATWAVNHAYDANEFGADCTNFVSKSMNEGGGLVQQSWWYHNGTYPVATWAQPWTVAARFADDMTAHAYVTRQTIDVSQRTIPGARLGDVILYDQDDGNGFNHVAIIVTVMSNGVVLIAQHTTNYSYRIWNRSWELSDHQAGWHAQLLHVRTDG
jgi:hypothetical protein